MSIVPKYQGLRIMEGASSSDRAELLGYFTGAARRDGREAERVVDQRDKISLGVGYSHALPGSKDAAALQAEAALQKAFAGKPVAKPKSDGAK